TWDIREEDLQTFDPSDFGGVNLVTAGVPCPPFSIAGKRLGPEDERDLFPAALKVIRRVRPRGVLFENVRGLATARFADYRKALQRDLQSMGYQSEWRVLNASEFGVP